MLVDGIEHTFLSGAKEIEVEFMPEATQTTEVGGLTKFCFSKALELLNKGKSVSRAGWNGKGLYLTKQVPDENSKMTRPYVYITTPPGSTEQFGVAQLKQERIPWLCSQTDLFAEDWFEVVL